MLKIGTSGFSFEDWRGTVYPQEIKKQDMLSFYEKELGFDTLEVNYTYYQLPFPRTMEAMARKTSENFTFVVRSHKEMTHEIWDEEKKLLDTSDVFEKFRFGLQPLIDYKKLGCVLLQFPSFFWPNKENKDYLIRCREMLKDLPLVIEFRNSAWVKEETFTLLRENNFGYCTVDEPQIPRLMPFVPEVTSKIAYIRLHGRNKNWYNAPVSERYNYLYSDVELNEFVPRIREIGRRADVTYLFFNNCHGGAAAKNALKMKELFSI